MTTSPISVRVGAQEPRFLSRPEGGSSAGQETVELARAAGLVLDPWQELAVDVACVEVGERWAAREVGLIVARQNGKGSILEARELAGLFLFGERLIIHSAHEFKTAQEAFVRVLGLVEANDWLRKRVARVRTSHGEEGIELITGERLRFVARSTGSGRGFTGDVVILDEAYALQEAHLGALIPTMSARSITGNPQIWYTSSAPLPTSTVLHRVRNRGRAGDPGLAYLEWSAPEDSDLDDRDAWYEANPGLGIRISEEFIADTERAAMSAENFARERLSIAPELDETEKVFGPGVWEAVNHGDVAQPDDVTFALDVNPERTVAALAVASPGGSCGLLEQRDGVGWVVDEAIRVGKARSARVAVASNSPAGALIPDLERAGVRVVPVPSGDYRDACGRFFDDVVNRRVVVKRDHALDAAVSCAVKKPSGDGFVWDRRSGDVTALVALTLAVWAASTTVPTVPAGFVDLADFVNDEE